MEPNKYLLEAAKLYGVDPSVFAALAPEQQVEAVNTLSQQNTQQPEQDPSYLSRLGTQIGVGARQTAAGLSSFVGADETAKSIADKAVEVAAQDPKFMEQNQELRKVFEEQGTQAALAYMASNPSFSGLFLAQQAPNAALYALGALVGAAAAPVVGPTAAVALGTGLGASASGASSAGSSVLEAYQELLGTNDPAVIEEAMKDPTVANYINLVARNRFVIDTGTAAVGGQLSRMVPLKSTVGQIATNMVVQPAVGATGEYLSQKATAQEDPFGVFAEAVGEVGGAFVEPVLNKAIDTTTTSSKTPDRPAFEEDTTAQATTESIPTAATTQTSPIEIPPTLLTGTYEQRLNRFAQKNTTEEMMQKAEKLGIDPMKPNKKGTPVRKPKKELAKEILSKYGVKEGIDRKAMPVTPEVTPQEQAPPTLIEYKLPKDLSGAKPKFGYRNTNNEVNFESDVDRALFIVSQKKKSARDADYRKWLKDQVKLTDAEIDSYSTDVRQRIKEQAATANGTINIPKMYEPKMRVRVKAPTQVASPFVQQLRAATLNSKITPTKEQEAALLAAQSRAREGVGVDREDAIATLTNELNKLNAFEQSRASITKDIIDSIKANDPEAGKAIAEMVAKDPMVAPPLLKSAVMDMLDKPPSEGEPRFISTMRKIIGDRPARASTTNSSVVETPEQLQKRVQDNNLVQQYTLLSNASEFDKRTFNLLFPAKGRSITAADMEQEYGDFGWLDHNRLWVRSAVSLARDYPFIGKLLLAINGKSRAARIINDKLLGDFNAIIDKFGRDTTKQALYIMSEMSGPKYPEGQKVEYTPDGRLRFRNQEGKRLLASIEQTNAFKSLMDLNKTNITYYQEGIINRLRQANPNLPRNITPEMLGQLANVARQSGTTKEAESLTEAKKTLDYLEKLKQANRPYFPHIRARGKNALAFYVDGELVGLYTVKDKPNSNKPDQADLKRVMERVRSDMKADGRQWTTKSGAGIEQVQPFVMNSNNIRQLAERSALRGKNLELLSTIMLQKGIKSSQIDSVLKQFDTLDDIEKIYAGFRDRGSFYGFDNEDYLNTYAGSLSVSAGAITNLATKASITRLFNTVKSELDAAGAPNQVKDFIMDYEGRMSGFGNTADQIRSFSYMYFMALNMSSAFMQLTAPLTTTSAHIKQWASTLDTAKAMSMAPIKMVPNLMWMIKNRSKFDTITAKELASKGSGVSQQMADEILDIQARGGFAENPSLDTITDRPRYGKDSFFNKVMNAFIPAAETAARLQSYVMLHNALQNDANYQRALGVYGKDKFFRVFIEDEYGGVPSRQAVAHFAMQEAHGLYGRESRARILENSVAAVAAPLIHYAWLQTENVGRFLIGRDSKGFMDKGFFNNPEGLKTLAAIAVAGWLYGGMSGVAFFEPLDWFITLYQKYVKGRKADAKLLLSEALLSAGFSPEAVQVARNGLLPQFTKGLQQMAGLEESQTSALRLDSRIALNSPGLTIAKTAVNGLLDPSTSSFTDLLGAPGSFVENTVSGVNKLRTGDVMGAVTDVLPSGLKNPLKAYQLTQGELTDARGNPYAPPAGIDRTAQSPINYMDVLSQAIGFTPEGLKNIQEARRTTKMLDNPYQPAILAAKKEAARVARDWAKGEINQDEASQKISQLFVESNLAKLYEANQMSPEEGWKDLTSYALTEGKEALNPVTGRLSKKSQVIDPYAQMYIGQNPGESLPIRAVE